MKKQNRRQRRRKRVRKKIMGSPQRPRLSVFRSNKNIYCQLIDDWSGRTLASASTQDPELRKQLESCSDLNAAKKVGSVISAKAKEAGISTCLFDRGAYRFHGRVKALADEARKGGLKF